MNILLLGTGIPTESMRGVGGAGLAVIKIAEILSRTDSVYVIPRWSERPTILRKDFVINGVEYIRRRISLELVFLMIRFSLSGSFKAVTKYAHGLNKVKYALLYIFDRAHIEATLERFKIDIVNVHGLDLHHLPYIEATIEDGMPLVCTSHGIYTFNPDIHLDFDKSFERDILRRISDADGTVITTVSTKVRELCISHFGISSDRIRVIMNGVDHERFGCVEKAVGDLRDRHSIPQDKVVLLQVGTLNERKNHRLVLNAIMRMEGELKGRLLYVVVGEGEERRILERIVRENGLDNCVIFMGFTSSEKLVDMYHLSDFLILPSTSEGFPSVFLEAMAAGLPIITYKDLEGVSDISNPECMELISHMDTDSVIAAIDRASKRKWDQEKIEEHSRLWKWEVVIREYRRLYTDLMAERRQ